MAAVPTETERSFEAALKVFRSSLSGKDKEDFKFMTLDKLRIDIDELQKEQGTERKLQNLNRLNSFLEGMREYESIVELFLNASPFVAFVWGPIKFLLRTASTYAEAFDSLLDAYQQIGEAFPLLERYKDVYRSQPHMAIGLALIYEDILHFHCRAMEYFEGRKWTKMFRALWKTFSTDFSRILSNLASHRRLIESHATIIQFEEFKRDRDIAQERWRLLHEDELRRRRISVNDWLKGSNVHDNLHEVSKPRELCPQTGRWLLSMDLYKTWSHPDISPAPVLWLTGIPGSGKTVLATVAVDDLKSKRVNVIYFFCWYKDPQRNNFSGLAKSLLRQLLVLNPTLLQYLYEEQCTSGEGGVLSSPDLIKKLLETAMESVDDLHLVLDGIDECPPKEMEAIFSWFLNLAEKSSHKQSGIIRCLFVSQHESIARKHLRVQPTIKIKQEYSKDDISSYIKERVIKMRQTFHNLEESKAAEIGEKLMRRADGLFLFVVLVSENLLKQSSKDKLLFEVEDDKFPKNLGEAYARIVHRILDNVTNPEDVIWLLECLVCAKRPMRWHEFQATVTIDVDNQEIDSDGRRLRYDAKELGGSIIEFNTSGGVELVHRTAETYLVQQKHVVKSRAELALAKLCLGYLSLPSLAPNCSPEEYSEFAQLGHYAFLDYAVAHWHGHLESALAAGQELRSLDELSEYLDIFLKTSYISGFENHSKALKVGKVWRVFADKPYFDRLTWSLHATKKQVQASGRLAAANEALTLHITLQSARQAVESSYSSSSTMELFYGTDVFKCPRLNCRRFYDGFDSDRARKGHVDAHDRPYKCTFEVCPNAGLSFISQRSLNKHLLDEHNINTTSDEQFPSLEPIKRQLDSIEDDLDPVMHTKISEEKHECTFLGCGKIFTRKHNLIAHLRSHNRERPYHCKTCGIRFGRTADCTRHERSHVTNSRILCGGLLESADGSAIQWGCGKDFSRKDYLKAHFRTEVGKECIKPLLEHKARTGASSDDLDFL